MINYIKKKKKKRKYKHRNIDKNKCHIKIILTTWQDD